MRTYLPACLCITLLLCCRQGWGKRPDTVIADSVSRTPLPNASVYDSKGNAVAITDRRGKLPYIRPEAYPVTIRYIGFGDKEITRPGADTVFLSRTVSDLPEVVVAHRRDRPLHILAYVREYSTLTTYTDTVFLFREKMVDYMIPSSAKSRFKGWDTPRVLSSRSYYRFTDANGLDSVSDTGNYHFSWSDWVGIPAARLPRALKGKTATTDTIRGKYSPAEIWRKDGDRLDVEINVLAAPETRRWVPRMTRFFNTGADNPEFDDIRLGYSYDNITSDSIRPADLDHYSLNIESTGRGHGMFRFNRPGERFFVSTSADIYILDREYITLKEARKWEKREFNSEITEIYEPMEAPRLEASIQLLVDRVDRIDKDGVKLENDPDRKLISQNVGKGNFRIANRALTLLKDLTGITLFKSRRNMNRRWKEFRDKRLDANYGLPRYGDNAGSP